MRRSAVCLGIGERAFRRDTRNTDYEAHQSATFLIGGDIGMKGNINAERTRRRHQRNGQREGELDATVPAQWIQRMVWSIVYTGLHATGVGLVARDGVDDLIRWTLRGAISAR
ncbi:hypothetical protein [Streptomyces rubiginosohelvolus]|uniref:hypothetical protein n=1 Tax=Streptomyces rubiginosohelvolus TaxID=67362 RepID=UPI0035DFCE67